MLKELCNGTEGSKCILIKDSAHTSGRSVFLTLISGLSQRVDHVVLFCWEKPPCYYTALIPSRLTDSIVLVDCTDDPLNWLDMDLPTVDSSLTSLLGDQLSDSDHKCAVALDGLSFLMLHRPVPHTCQTLHKLKTCKPTAACTVEQVIALVHSDLHSSHEVSMLEHVTTSIIHVTPSPDPQYHMSCSTVHQRVSSKITKTMELVQLDGVNILSTHQVHSVKTSPHQTDTIDPAANLTFNLTLSNKEKEARRQLVLPYVNEQTRQPMTLNSGSGKIFYEPDDADDFDEEDPDEDLDI